MYKAGIYSLVQLLLSQPVKQVYELANEFSLRKNRRYDIFSKIPEGKNLQTTSLRCKMKKQGSQRTAE